MGMGIQTRKKDLKPSNPQNFFPAKARHKSARTRRIVLLRVYERAREHTKRGYDARVRVDRRENVVFDVDADE